MGQGNNDNAPAGGSGEGPESVDLRIKRKPLWPFFAVLFTIVAAAGATTYWYVSRPDPFKVLVAIDVNGQWWEGSRPAAALADQIGEGLKKIGFEPVSGGDPGVEKTLSKAKTPEEAARKLGAGFIIEGSLSPDVIEHRIGDGSFFEARSVATLRVRYVGDDEGVSAAVPVSAWADGESSATALAVLSDRVAERVFDAAVPKILEHEVIKSRLDKGDLGAVVRLNDAKKYVDLRARRLEEARKLYAKAEADHKATGPEAGKIAYHGTFDELTYLAATGDDRVLVLTANVSPFVHPVSMELQWSYQLETLAWRGRDGKDEVLWSGYHVLGLPAAGPKGPAVFVEDLFGRAKTISVVRNGSKPERLRVDAKARFDDVAVSRGGAAVAIYRRPCRNCGSNFEVVSLSDGSSLYERRAAVPGEQSKESYFGFAWLDDKQVFVAVKSTVPPPPPEPSGDPESPDPVEDDPKRGGEELRVIDISRQPPLERLIAQIDSASMCYAPDVSPDGKTIALTCDDLVTFVDAATGDETRTKEPGASVSWSPDGSRIVFVRGGDIYLMTVADKKVTQLTSNEFAENRPMFSPDGKTVYFQSQQQDPNIPRRITSVVASVEAR